jgi:hypothetical protein
VDDFHWLAYRLAQDTRRPWVHGAATTVAWIRGGRTGPITNRDEWPVEENHARAELWAALAVGDTPGNTPPFSLIATRLNVPAWPIAPRVTLGHAEGVWRTLRWLLGHEGQPSPIPLPIRQDDGQPVTAEQLVATAINLQPTRFRHPEQRLALNTEAVTTARRYRELVDLIDETRHRLSS